MLTYTYGGTLSILPSTYALNYYLFPNTIYIQTYIHTYIHTYKHTNIHTYHSPEEIMEVVVKGMEGFDMEFFADFIE
jgi:hypothetical protein